MFTVVVTHAGQMGAKVQPSLTTREFSTRGACLRFIAALSAVFVNKDGANNVTYIKRMTRSYTVYAQKMV